MNRDSGDLPIKDLALARVEAGAYFEPERLDAINDCLSATDRASRPIEAREKAVAGGIDLSPSETQ